MRRCRLLTARAARRFQNLLLLFLAAGPLAGRAPAASGAWSPTATTGTWQTAGNWIGVVPGATSGTTNSDTAIFNSSSTTTTIIPDAGRNLEFITFDTSATAYTIGTIVGNGLLLTSGGTIQIASTFNGSGISESINAPLILEGSYTFADNSPLSNDTLNFGGAPISSGVAGTQTLTISSSNSSVNINGVIGGGVGTIAVVKNGGGNSSLSNNETFSGGLTVNAGTISLFGNNTFTGGVTINGGTLELFNAGALNSASPNAIAFGSNSTGALTLGGESVTVTGLTTNVNAGTAVIQNSFVSAATLTVNNAGPNTFAGVLQDGAGGGPLRLSKSGAGTLILSGNNTFTGGVTITNGNLQLGSTGALNAVSPNALTFGAPFTGTLSLAGNSVTIGSLFLPSLAAIQNSSLTPATLTVSDSTIDTALGTFQDGAGGGPLSLVKSGSGVLALFGNNTFTGPVTINAGALNASSPGALNSTSPVAVGFGPGSTGGLRLATPITTVSALTTNAIVGTPYVNNATASPATLVVNNIADNVFAGALESFGTGAISLVKSGAGTLTLRGANSFNGDVTINAGALQMGNTGALGAQNAIHFGPASTGILSLNGFSVTVGGLSSDVNVGTPLVRNGSASIPATLTVNNVTDNAYGGNLQDGGLASLSLIQAGPGTLTLSGANFYSGPTTITGGTLAMSGGFLNSTVLNQSNFVYSGGSFNGRLINAGVVTFNADFAAGNGLENDSSLSISSGRTVTLNGAGLDNEGTLTLAGGTLALGAFGVNINRGNFNLSPTVPFNLGAAGFTNSGTINLNGGLFTASSGLLSNSSGGTINGPGTIQSALNNSGGLIAVVGGTTNLVANSTNSGAIQLSAINANLTGGSIVNLGSIQGFGNLGNGVANSGIIEAMGGTLFVTSLITNPAAGTLTADSGAKLLITQGLSTNAGIVNLTGGIFDNNLHPLNNTGQISGWGIFRTGGAGLDNNGSITFSGGLTTVNGPITNEGGHTITVAQNNAIFTGMVTNNMTATFNTVNATATFAGGFTNNGNSNFAAVGNGSINVPVAPAFGNASSLAVGGASTMRFNAISGAASVGTGVTATVTSTATLELAGSVSALSTGSNRVNVTNNSSAAAGILVSGTNQAVGNIDGSGATQVSAGSDLTANHIVQSALVIGGTAGSHGLVTIDASDASGNSLDSGAGDLGLGTGRQSGSPLGEGGVGSLGLLAAGATGSGGPNLAGSTDAGASMPSEASAVPEPSTLWLVLLGLCGLGIKARRVTTV
jgi:fibronectin-binding autotransporter adhesin